MEPVDRRAQQSKYLDLLYFVWIVYVATLFHSYLNQLPSRDASMSKPACLGVWKWQGGRCVHPTQAGDLLATARPSSETPSSVKAVRQGLTDLPGYSPEGVSLLWP